MNKDIDYDELDQAVSSAMETSGAEPEQSSGNTNFGSVSERGVHAPIPSPSAATAPREDGRARVASPENSVSGALRHPTTRPKPRGFYLDMVNPKSPMRPLKSPTHPTPSTAQKPTLAPKPTTPRHATEFGVIEDFISEPTPIEPEILDAAEDPAPNPENYALGGRSPFLENAIVEKRPLSDHIPDSHARSVRSTKNVYSERLVTSRQPAKPPIEHEIIPDKRPSGIARFLLVLLVIAIGAGIGAGAWYLISSGIISL